MAEIRDHVKEVIMPILADEHLELVDIEYKKGKGGWTLRIFIDKEKGVTLDDCEKASREISALLDVKDIIHHAYNLEVSSPGLDRPLTKLDDFIRYRNKKARLKTKTPLQGRRNFSIVIEGVRGENVVVRDSEGKTWEIPIADIEKAKLEIQL